MESREETKHTPGKHTHTEKYIREFILNAEKETRAPQTLKVEYKRQRTQATFEEICWVFEKRGVKKEASIREWNRNALNGGGENWNKGLMVEVVAVTHTMDTNWVRMVRRGCDLMWRLRREMEECFLLQFWRFGMEVSSWLKCMDDWANPSGWVLGLTTGADHSNEALSNREYLWRSGV